MMKRVILFIWLAGFSVHQAGAQEDHYWSQQFGAVSTLMGGAMVAGVNDNSAVFYNPGGLAQIGYSNLSVDANIYRLDRVRISNGAGSGMNLNTAQVSIYPQIISGMVNYFSVPRLRIAYSLLTRNFSNILMNARYTKNIPPSENGDTYQYLGTFDFVNQLNEQWFGITAAWKVSDNVGIGLTMFGYYRGQTSGLTNKSTEVTTTDSTSVLNTTNNSENVKFMSVGGLFKAGIACTAGKWKFGATLTTPSFNLYGDGSIRREESYYSTASNGSSAQDPYVILAESRSGWARYRNPLSVSAGIEFRSATTRIALSAEYFTRISPYSIMEPAAEPFVYPSTLPDSTGTRDNLDHYLYVSSASRPVLNAGFGFSQTLWKKLELIIGGHTDFSSYEQTSDERKSMQSAGKWDLYYVSTGFSYHRPKQTVTLGFTYCFSPRMQIPPISIVNPGTPPETMAHLFSQTFSLVLGYTYYFPR